MATVMKTDEGELARSFWNRQSLRQTILQRRGVSDLREILTNFKEEEDVKHYELTAEDVERRERRKEQNRRAARKCRQKKQEQRGMIAQMWSTLQAANQDTEEEIWRLRRELVQLRRLLEDHNRSGVCHLTPPSSNTESQSSVLLASPAALTSPVTSLAAMTSPMTSPTVLTSPAALTSPVTSPESWEATPLPVDDGCDAQPGVDWERCLQDLVESVVPDSTLANLETFLNLESLDSIKPPCLLSADIFQQQQHQHQHQQQQLHHRHQQQQQSSPPPQPQQQQHGQPLHSSAHSFAFMENPESLEHSSLYACPQDQSLLCPLTAITNQNHPSMSASTTSDWSSIFPSFRGPLGDLGGVWSPSFSVVPVIVVEDEDIGGDGEDVFLFD